MSTSLSREDKKALCQALWNIYQPVEVEDWKTVERIKDKNLKIIKNVLESLPKYLEYEENGEKIDYIPSDYSYVMSGIIFYPKSVPEAYEWLEKSLNDKIREGVLISISSIFYMTYML